MVRVIHAPNKLWSVVDDDGSEVAANLSNVNAWRIADKLNNDHLSRSEETAEWSFKSRANGQ